jgi:plastocyanin
MRRASTAALAAVATFALVSCDGTGGGTPAQPTDAAASSSVSPSAPPSTAPSGTADEETGTGAGEETGTEDVAEAVEIQIEGDRVTPNGKQVEVAAGEEVTFAVTSDRAAELHVHSSPEQVLEVEKGRSTVTLVIERPGVVDVEEHESGLVVVRLEVR